jgi:hypothetical protein
MSTSRSTGRNSASVRSWEVPLRRCATDTNEHEKAQTPTLSVEALRNIADIVRAIKARINGAHGHDQDHTARGAPLDPGSRPATSPMGGEDSHSAEKETR